MIEDLDHDAVVVYRVVAAQDVIFRDELEALARERGVAIHYVVGDHRDPGGERLLSAAHLVQLIPDLAERSVYVCGPPAMTDLIEKNVREAGVPRRQIHTERFAL